MEDLSGATVPYFSEKASCVRAKLPERMYCSLATVGALGYGLWCFRQGRSKMSQYMMRARIVAQGFTLVALLIGVSITATQAPKDDKK
uniref:HIG1 domain-containing protein n=1 Tax=Timema tahoe TaxID=61484 RepID=A0A7R9FH23_9NEOP|nr:unnamed protein product [Timema tahoe]